MNEETEKQIVDELRNLTASIRKVNKANTVGIALVVAILTVFVLYGVTRIHSLMSSESKAIPQSVDSWKKARILLTEGEYEKAQGMLQRLIQKYPDCYYGYSLLGWMHQDLGNLKQAEENYAKSYDLFPTEEHEKTLAAIRKAIEIKEKGAVNKADTHSSVPKTDMLPTAP